METRAPAVLQIWPDEDSEDEDAQACIADYYAELSEGLRVLATSQRRLKVHNLDGNFLLKG